MMPAGGMEEDEMRDAPSRRHFLGITALAAVGLPLADAFGQTPLPATPECADAPTLRQTEGPFYKPRSPERADLREPGTGGRVIELSGFVLARDCKPLS